jgi:hypothetical protein
MTTCKRVNEFIAAANKLRASHGHFAFHLMLWLERQARVWLSKQATSSPWRNKELPYRSSATSERQKVL